MKDYKKILEGVVNIVNNTDKSDIGFANICTFIGENCPELKESEDERIRKSCIHVLELQKHHHTATFAIEECIDWLEKQGEQKPIKREEFISIPFGTDSEFIKEAITIPDGCVATIEGNRIHIKKI